MPRAKLSEATIPKLETGPATRFYFDSKTTGFGVYVTPKGIRTYFVKRRVNGKQVKTSIERCNLISLDEARTRAERLLVGMKEGVNPQEEKKGKKAIGMTLQEVLDEYLVMRNVKPGTVKTYKKLFNFHLQDWLNKPIAEITPDKVLERFNKITNRDPLKKSMFPANNVMRTFSGIYNFARGRANYKIPDNPVSILTTLGVWHKLDRRDTIIKFDDLPKWFKAVSEIENPLQRDYLLLLLFTGLRREEVAELRWEYIDFKAKTLKIPDPKNGKPHTVYLSDLPYSILKHLWDTRTGGSDYVFPGQGKSGHIYAPYRAMRKITKETGVSFCINDLRREFSTIAENHVTGAVLKRFLNHSTGNDVTLGYIKVQPDTLKTSMQLVAEAIMSLVNDNTVNSNASCATHEPDTLTIP